MIAGMLPTVMHDAEQVPLMQLPEQHSQSSKQAPAVMQLRSMQAPFQPGGVLNVQSLDRHSLLSTQMSPFISFTS